jgi:hypothetical protein
MDQVLPTASILYCHTRTVRDRRPYPYPREQEMRRVYPDYKTSLGPWSEADIVDFFTVDYRRDESRWPFTRQAIADFFRSGEQLLVRRWVEPLNDLYGQQAHDEQGKNRSSSEAL